MMPSSSQVLDHQLIFHIMYGLRQFHHRQNKGEERRGEIWQKTNSCLAKNRAVADGKNSQKTVILHLWLSSQAQSYYPCTMHTEMEK